jgi:PPP family 3-phenylpropionic acid transporter
MSAVLASIPRPVRFALFYGAFYLGFGAYLPYMPVWYEGRGLSPEMIGAAAAASMAGRVIAAPLGAMLADRAPKKRWAVLSYTLVSFLRSPLSFPPPTPGRSSYWRA